MKMLSIEEATDQLAALVEAAERGEEIVLTRNGTPVVEFKPAERRSAPSHDREAAWQRLRMAMDKGFPNSVGRFSREEIYDDRMRELEERRNRNR